MALCLDINIVLQLGSGQEKKAGESIWGSGLETSAWVSGSDVSVPGSSTGVSAWKSGSGKST